MCLVVGYLMVVHNNIPDMTIICIIHVHTSCRQSHLPWTRMPPFFCLFVCSVFIVVCLCVRVFAADDGGGACVYIWLLFFCFFFFHFICGDGARVVVCWQTPDASVIPGWCDVFLFTARSAQNVNLHESQTVCNESLCCVIDIYVHICYAEIWCWTATMITQIHKKKRVEKEIYILTLDLVMFHVEIKPIIIGNVDLWW